jgi:hypothetical protein
MEQRDKWPAALASFGLTDCVAQQLIGVIHCFERDEAAFFNFSLSWTLEDVLRHPATDAHAVAGLRADFSRLHQIFNQRQPKHFRQLLNLNPPNTQISLRQLLNLNPPNTQISLRQLLNLKHSVPPKHAALRRPTPRERQNLREVSQTKLPGSSVNDHDDQIEWIAALIQDGFSAAELFRAGSTISELRELFATSSDGFSIRELYNAGCKFSDLLDIGFAFSNFNKEGISTKELFDAGCKLTEFLDFGFDLPAIKGLFPARQMRIAGFSCSALAAAEYSSGDLIQAGFDINSVMATGLPMRGLKVSLFVNVLCVARLISVVPAPYSRRF